MADYNMSDELLALATPRGGGHGDGVPSGQGAPVESTTTGGGGDDDNAMDDGSLQVRTMEVPRWLSTTDVTGEFPIVIICKTKCVNVCTSTQDVCVSSDIHSVYYITKIHPTTTLHCRSHNLHAHIFSH
jgi:hypothetical protein